MRRVLEPESMDSPEEVIAYERIVKRLGFWMEDPIVRILSRLIKGLNRTDFKILDIGGGTGRVSIKTALKIPTCKIWVVDSSPNMFEIARKNISDKKLTDRIIVRQADGKNLPFENNFFDAVICSNMLHHIRDHLVLLKEMKRVVKDKGIIVIRDLIRPGSKFLLNIMVSLVGVFHNSLMKKEYSDSLCASFTVREFEEIIKSSGIEGLRIHRGLVDYVSGYITLINKI